MTISSRIETAATLLGMLSPKERRSAIALFGSMVLAMLLEMLSIGLVVPAIAVMVGRPEVMDGVGWLEPFRNLSSAALISLGLGIILATYLVKTAVLAFTMWQQHAFLSSLHAELSRRLYEVYLRQPWTFHLQRNSSELLCNLDKICVVNDTVAWTLIFIAELLVLSGIMALLVWFEPLGAIAVGVVMILATLILDRLMKQRLLLWGALQEERASLRSKHMHQGMHGVKEALIRGASGFLRQFTEANAAYSRMASKRGFIANLPRLWYELVAVAALCTLTAAMAAQGKSPQAMLPVLGLFAVAAFRILPSVNRLATAGHVLRFNQPVIQTIRNEFALENSLLPLTESAEPLRFEREIVVERVSYRYPDAQGVAIEAIDMKIPIGSSVGLVGSSGSGKSTLVDIILGLLSPASGRVTVDGVDITTNLPGWQRRVGYVSQSIYLTDDTIRRNVAFGLPDHEIDDAAVRRAILAAQLEGFVDSLPNGLDTMVGERGVRLSGGQRQRIGIARALYHDPHTLLLDEATSALDSETERGVMEAVHQLHGVKTLVIVAHRLTTVAGCDTIYRLEAGRIVHAGHRLEPASVS